MNNKIVFLLVLSSSIFFNKCMDEFGQQCIAAHTRYTAQELEKEREKNRDIEGYTKTTLSNLNFLLRAKDAQDPLMLDYYNHIEVYQKEGELSYIDLHVRKVELVQNFIDQQMKCSEDLAGIMQYAGFFDKFEGSGIDIISKIFNNCTINRETHKFNTDNILQDILKINHNDLSDSDSEEESTEELEKNHNKLKQKLNQQRAQHHINKQKRSMRAKERKDKRLQRKQRDLLEVNKFFEKLCYAGGGFVLALPIYYFCFHYFKSSK